MTYEVPKLDALGDGTRRAILEILLKGPLPVGKLAEQLPVSRPAISQHLRTLRLAGLVSEQTSGTRHVYAIDPQGFDSLREYFDRFWNQALNAFKDKVEEQ
jgi:DNA-binding transcriptional ArsR family regulator